MAHAFDSAINRCLVDALFASQATRLLNLALPLGFRLLGQMIFQQQALFPGQTLDAIQDFMYGFAHGNTSNEGGPGTVVGQWPFSF